MSYRRHLEQLIAAAMADTPVVMVHGARQTGKTTLVKAQGSGEGSSRSYRTFDDPDILASAMASPRQFIFEADTLTLDEVQLAPQLFPVIKLAVDEDRRAGRFLLTGSANILSVPKVSESLAGRMEILTLWPLSQAEIEGTPGTLIDDLFNTPSILPKTKPKQSQGRPLWERVLAGGFPEVLSRSAQDRRRAWFRAYITTITERDVRDLANVEHLRSMPQLLRLLAARAGNLLVFSDVARDLGLPASTVKRYINLLETTFLVRMLPGWAVNLNKRVVKAPKVYLLDTGLLAHLLDIDANRLTRDPGLRGPLLENFVYMELVKLIGWSKAQPSLYHYRSHHDREVDFVLEHPDGRIVGIEVKSGDTVDPRDARNLEDLRDTAGDRFHQGILLYPGTNALALGDRISTMPIQGLWGG